MLVYQWLLMQEQANNSVIFRSCNRKCNHNSIIRQWPNKQHTNQSGPRSRSPSCLDDATASFPWFSGTWTPCSTGACTTDEAFVSFPTSLSSSFSARNSSTLLPDSLAARTILRWRRRHITWLANRPTSARKLYSWLVIWIPGDQGWGLTRQGRVCHREYRMCLVPLFR